MRARNTSTDIVPSARFAFHAAPPEHESGRVQDHQCRLQTLIVARKYFELLAAPANCPALFSNLTPTVSVMVVCIRRQPADFRLN